MSKGGKKRQPGTALAKEQKHLSIISRCYERFFLTKKEKNKENKEKRRSLWPSCRSKSKVQNAAIADLRTQCFWENWRKGVSRERETRSPFWCWHLSGSLPEATGIPRAHPNPLRRLYYRKLQLSNASISLSLYFVWSLTAISTQVLFFTILFPG